MLPAHDDHEDTIAKDLPQNKADTSGDGRDLPVQMGHLDSLSYLPDKDNRGAIDNQPSALSEARPTLHPIVRLILDLGRGSAALLILLPSLLFVLWLTLLCADFLSLNRFGPGLARYWYDFAMRVSLGILLPPFIIAGMGTRYAWNVRLLQACRAALITFLMYAVGFFCVVGLAFHFFTSMQVGLVPELLRRMGPWVFCLLLWVSYRLTAYLLPHKPNQGVPPFAMRLFSSLALVTVGSLLLMALAPLGPLGMPSLSPDFYDLRALPQDMLLYMGTATILFRQGWGAFRPAWVVLCIIGPFATLYGSTLYPLPWQIFHGAVAAVALLSCLCLYTPRARRWLTD